jgi:polyadenylate-binding protein
MIAREEDGRSKGYGFVMFLQESEADAAIEALNNVPQDDITWSVEKFLAKPERRRMFKIKFEQLQRQWKETNVYIKDLPESIDEPKLANIFSECGEIDSVKIIYSDNTYFDEKGDKNVTRSPVGSGFVAFKTPDAARKALTTMNGKQVEGK